MPVERMTPIVSLYQMSSVTVFPVHVNVKQATRQLQTAFHAQVTILKYQTLHTNNR